MDSLSVYTVLPSHTAPSLVIKLSFTATAVRSLCARYTSSCHHLLIQTNKCLAAISAQRLELLYIYSPTALFYCTVMMFFDDHRHSGEFLYIWDFKLPEKRRKRLTGGPSVSRDLQVHCLYDPQEAEESPDLKRMFKEKRGWKTLQLFLRRPAEPQAVVWP